MKPDAILRFWFDETGPKQWFAVDSHFDTSIAARFGVVHAQAAAGELYEWRADATGRLAEIIVLDQFSRNIFRDTPGAFACDAMALVLAQEAVRAGIAAQFAPERRAFLYMPYMHSESRAIHAIAERLFAEPGLDYNLNFERSHRAIIDRFGRYPHRNAILGRVSTPEEIEFLQQPGSSF